MALIICNECEKEYSDQAESCPNCACPNYQYQKTIYVEKNEKYIGYWSSGRLVVGIFSFLIALVSWYQSGLLFAAILIAGGITGISTRNSLHNSGAVASSILYFIGFIFAGDIGNIFGIISFAFGVVFFICARKV